MYFETLFYGKNAENMTDKIFLWPLKYRLVMNVQRCLKSEFYNRVKIIFSDVNYKSGQNF
jgi:hypothetical protein